MKKIKKFQDGSLLKKSETAFLFTDVDGNSNTYSTPQEAEEEYYIKQARDYYGSDIRDNSRSECISIGKDVDKGDI